MRSLPAPDLRIFAEVTIGRHVLEVAPISPFCTRCVGGMEFTCGHCCRPRWVAVLRSYRLARLSVQGSAGTGRGDLARAARKNPDPADVLLRSEYRIAEAKERLSGDWRS